MAVKKYFPAQEDTEKVFLLIRRHWFTYSIFWLLSFLMILPIIAVTIVWTIGLIEINLVTGNIIILGGSIYMLGLLALLLYGFVDYYLDVYIVTDRRIVDIKQNGFFRREISELYLREVQDVNAKVIGFFPTVLHFGEVIIQTAGEIDNFIFNSVPHPYQISKTIMDLHESIISESSNEEDIARRHKKFSKKELSKGRFDETAIASTKEFFRDDSEKKKPEKELKLEEKFEGSKEIEKKASGASIVNNATTTRVENRNKNKAEKEGELEEGKLIVLE